MREQTSVPAYDLEILPHERTAFVKGRLVDLTAREFDILVRLTSHPGWVYSSEQLSDAEEGAADASPDSVRVHIAHLRHKLSAAGAERVIGTVRGVGYRLETSSASDVGTPSDLTGTQAAAQTDSPHETEGRTRSRQLRDAFWLLERAVLELESTGDSERIEQTSDALDEARRTITDLLARGVQVTDY